MPKNGHCPRANATHGTWLFLLLVLVTGVLIFARPAHAYSVDESTESTPPVIGISIGNSYSSVGFKDSYVIVGKGIGYSDTR